MGTLPITVSCPLPDGAHASMVIYGWKLLPATIFLIDLIILLGWAGMTPMTGAGLPDQDLLKHVQVSRWKMTSRCPGSCKRVWTVHSQCLDRGRLGSRSAWLTAGAFTRPTMCPQWAYVRKLLCAAVHGTLRSQGPLPSIAARSQCVSTSGSNPILL